MKIQPLPPQAELLRVFRYDPEAGEIFRRSNGKRAFASMNTCGHLQGKHRRRQYLAHRIIWKMVTGSDPVIIDHDNRIKTDNRFHNLKSGTQSDNSKNVKKRSDNSTGVTGVAWSVSMQKWQSYISDKGRRIHLGTFGTFDAAVEARKNAEPVYQYHPNHGRG